MSPDIISAHLVSARTAEIQAQNSAGGIVSACGHDIMSPDIIIEKALRNTKGDEVLCQ